MTKSESAKAPRRSFDFRLTLHRKLIISFSLSSALLILVGSVCYYYSALESILIVTSLSVALVMVTGFVIYRSITAPLESIKAKLGEIASKNFEVEITENKRCDEFGELARSITYMKDQLREKDRQKDEFINIASHELRTPIQPIIAYIELAKNGVVPHEKAFQVVSLESMRLKRLADDILDVSRIEGKRLNLKMESFSVTEVVSKIVEDTKISLRNNSVVMSFESSIISNNKATDPQQPRDHVFADKYRIIQVITNLVNNSVKFTKTGSIVVSTRLIDNGGAVEITVSDTGGGIPDEIFPKLFEKFATMSVGQGTQHGTGLGLFICKAIVEAHSGSIVGLNNHIGGATFRVILPTEKLVHEDIGSQGARASQEILSSPTESKPARGKPMQPQIIVGKVPSASITAAPDKMFSNNQ